MRMRKKKNLDVRFVACADVMAFEPKEKRGKWRALFGNDNPLHLEIGCGKGRFAIGMAEQHPDINFIAVERDILDEPAELADLRERPLEKALVIGFETDIALLLQNLIIDPQIGAPCQAALALSVRRPWVGKV